MRTIAVLGVLALTAGCGARTTLSLGEDAAPATPDAGRRDAGRRDAGRPDAGQDAGAQVACARDADCAIGVCRAYEGLTPRDLMPMPLTCGAPTDGAPLGGACHLREDCDRGLCAIAGVCVRPCRSERDCDAREACREVYVPTSRRALQPLSACTAMVAAPDDVRVAGPEPAPRVVTIGDPVVDRIAPLGENGLVIWRGDPGAYLFLQQLRLTDGPVAWDAAMVTPEAPAPAWGVSPITLGGMVTMMYPNGPDTPQAPRGWEADLSSFGAPTETQRVVVQRAGEGTRFDLDVYLVGGNRWGSPDGAVPRALAGALEAARAILAPIGLTIGEVRVHDVVGGLRDRFEVLSGMEPPFDAPPDLDDMYRLSAGANRPAVHVFFVRMIEGALGIASGIPGPHVLPGTGASGVAIAADLIPDDQLGLVLVHEIGHYMGLFHTSELDGTVGDPFPDTPECRADRDVDRDGYLLPEECADAGADHVMFWAGVGPVVSEQQGELMRRAYFTQ